MTITQAAEKWKVNTATVLEYIGKGYIYGLSVSQNAEGNHVILPSISKPWVKRKPEKVTAMDQYILKAMENGGYVNATIMGISQEKFEERLKALLKSGAIYSKEPGQEDYSSNMGFIKAPQNQKSVSVEFSPTIEPKVEVNPSVEIKMNNQFGLINADIKLPFEKSEE